MERKTKIEILRLIASGKLNIEDGFLEHHIFIGTGDTWSYRGSLYSSPEIAAIQHKIHGLNRRRMSHGLLQDILVTVIEQD